MKFYIILILSILIFFTGCSQLNNSTPKTVIKETQKLKPENKKLIYKTIRDEISMYKLRGDKNYKAGYNYDALLAYEKVNFYEGYDAIPISKIDKINKQARQISKNNYRKLKKYNKKDKKRILLTLNKIMMNNPNYKDTTELFENIREDRKIKIFLNKLKNTLNMEIINNKSTTNNLIKINKAYENLIKYDYKNPLAEKARNILEKGHQDLIQDAKNSYNKGDLNIAKRKFTTISSIYKDDNTTSRYLLKIKTKQNIKSNLQTAKKALKEKNYIKAMEFSNKIIEVERNNEEANTIKLKAQNGCNQEISKLIHRGIKSYEQKNLDKAKNNFQEVLILEPNNNTALIYTKKIQRQLQTIKSLEEK